MFLFLKLLLYSTVASKWQCSRLRPPAKAVLSATRQAGSFFLYTDVMRFTRPRMSEALLAWYRRHGRRLPWRRTRDPYRILVSEVMLQQTQVDRVIPYYRAWLRRWPTVRTLAHARLSEVIRAWSGLGYNRRAVNLHRTAQTIVRVWQGRVPAAVADLETLPGIGAYTARAVAAFAFKQRVAFIDTNVRRVLGRVLLGKPFPGMTDDAALRPRLERLIPLRTPDLWHHALMDLGATVCLPRPRCAACPLRRRCRAYPAVLNAVRPTRKNSVAFHRSNRYWRGRIVQVLRSATRVWTAEGLFAAVGEHRLGRPLFRRLLADLRRDGLIVLVGKRIQLPE